MVSTAQTPPSGWLEGDWEKFIEATVTIVLGEQYSRAVVFPEGVGGRFPLVDVYSALSAMGSATKPALQLWLNNKAAEAYANEDFDQGDRYRAFYSCLTWNACRELAEMQKATQSYLNTEGVPQSIGNMSTACLARNWIGSWSTSYNQMDLTGSDYSVSGTYNTAKHSVSGTVESYDNQCILIGKWNHSNSNRTGDFIFWLTSENSFSGRWTEGSPLTVEDVLGSVNWTGTKKE